MQRGRGRRGYLLTQIAGGVWADKFGGKPILGFGVIWWSIATACTPFAAQMGLPFLLAARACMGIGEGVAMPAMNNLLSRRAATAPARLLPPTLLPFGTFASQYAVGTEARPMARMQQHASLSRPFHNPKLATRTALLHASRKAMESRCEARTVSSSGVGRREEEGEGGLHRPALLLRGCCSWLPAAAADVGAAALCGSCRWVPKQERSRSLALVYSGMYTGSIFGLALSPHMIARCGCGGGGRPQGSPPAAGGTTRQGRRKIASRCCTGSCSLPPPESTSSSGD